MINKSRLNEILASGKLENEEKYWQEQLSGELAVSRIPTDFGQINTEEYVGDNIEFEFPTDIVKRLLKISKGSEQRLFVLLIAGVKAILHKYTGNKDIIIGTPVTGKKAEKGRFNHLLALRSQLDDGMNFKEILGTANRTITGGMKNQNYPFFKMLEFLDIEDQPRFPLSGVMVLFENIQRREYIDRDVDLLCSFNLTDQRLRANLEYDTLLYKEATIVQLKEHLLRFFDQVTRQPGLTLREVELLTAADKEMMVVDWNDTDASYPDELTLHQLFEEQVRRNPEKTALVCGQEKLTYHQLNKRANGLAHHLRQQGVSPDTLIGILLERSNQMVVAILAILKAGGAYVPIDPDYPEDRIKYMLEDSQAPILISNKELLSKFQLEIEGEVVDINGDELETYSHDNPENINQPGDLAYIIYTSGSTGRPKGVMIEHRNVVRLMINDSIQFDFSQEDVWTVFHSFCFDFSVWEMYGPLLYGGKLVVIPKDIARSPRRYLELLKKEEVTVVNQTPTAFYNLSNEEMKTEDKQLKIRYIIFGGEALKPMMLKGFREKYPKTKLINMYGITETTVHVTYKEITEKEIETNISNIGVPIPTLSCYILDSHLQLVPIGVAGEICVGGAGVARGYLNRPQLTAEKFVENPFRPGERLYRSGDLGRRLSNGEMEYLGRIDRQVKIRGFRIELGEIEKQLLNYNQIRDVVVMAQEDNSGDKYLAAYFVAKGKLSNKEIRQHLGQELPTYMIPAYLIQLEEIPMTSNGKVDRKALPDPTEEIRSRGELVSPRNEREEKLAELWTQVLELEQVSIHDLFSDIGGDSIKAVRLVSGINREFMIDLQIKDLYTHQTIAELADFIDTISVGYTSDLEEGLAMIEKVQNSILSNDEERNHLPDDYEDFYPLSSIQQGMVFYTNIKPDEPVYHDQFVYEAEFKEFDYQIYQQAFQIMVNRHPILRTAFYLKEFDESIQVVHTDYRPEIGLDDLADLSTVEQNEAINKYLQDDLDNKFKFDKDILWRLRLFKLSDVHYSCVLSFHHAILDGWSVATLIAEFIHIYTMLQRGEEIDLPQLHASYKDYVAVGLKRKLSADVKEFWQDTLDGYTRNKLPFNISSKKINDLNTSKMLLKNIKGDLLARLKEQARRNGWSMKALCLSAYIYLLNIITTEKDIVTGVVTHDRPVMEDGDKILGCFLNTIPIRMNLEDEKLDKFELINRVNDYLIEVKPYEVFLADIAEMIGEKNSLQNPIFDTIFNYLDFHVLKDAENELVRGVESNPDLNPSEMTNTLFDLEVSITFEELDVRVKYSPNYFEDQDVETAVKLYSRILDKFSDPEDERLDITELITDQEKERIIYDFNDTIVDYPEKLLIHQLFEGQAVRTPDNTAMILGSEKMTYRELDERSNQLARLLRDQGVRSRDHVGIIAQRNFEMIIGMMAILKAGGAYIPVDPAYPQARQEYIMNNSAITALVTDGSQVMDFENTVVIDYDKLEDYSKENLELKKSSQDLAYVIYTSGSTGVPKGVMIEHHSAVNLINWVNKEFQVNQEDSLLFITSNCFDLSVYDIFGILASGGKFVIAQKEEIQDPALLAELMVKEEITFWDSVPTTMNHLINTLEESNNADYLQENLRLVFMSGDWIPVKLPDRLKNYFPNANVISLGGATEGTIWSIFYPIEEVTEYQTSIPYGRPLDNNFFYILDEDQNLVPWGVAGELYIGGVGVARGYMNNEEKTSASYFPDKFIDTAGGRMYRTGDLGRMLPDGNIEFLGRKDHQVKIRGFRVELGEIENQLLKHEDIKETVVVDKVDDSGNKFLCAYVVFGEQDSEEKIPVAQLREYLAQELPDYMIPSYFVHLSALPLNSNGKVDRKALPEPDGRIETGVEYVPPETGLEQELTRIWSDILRTDQFGIKDDFFELGGHSLKATQMALKVNKELKRELPLLEVFKRPTIEELAVYLEKVEGQDYLSIPKIKEEDYYGLSSAQERLFILNQLEEDSLGYNMPEALVVEGELDLERFHGALDQLIERHEALRTSFTLKDGVPVQKITESIDFQVDYHQFEDLEDIRISDFIRPFDLTKPPLFRVDWIQLIDKNILLFDLHHIIADGVSMGVLINDFISLYQGQQLEELRIQYKDFAHWQSRLFESERLKEEKEYWLDQFSGQLPVLDLPTDYPRPEEVDFRGSEVQFQLDQQLTADLKEIMKEEDATLYMTLLAAYNILLSKYSNGEDIIVGSPIAGRPHTDLEGIIGMFANTLAMRNYPTNDKSFSQFLAEVKENALQAYQHQNYQFEMLVEALNLERDLGRNPLFDTMLVLQNQDMAAQKMEDLTFRPYQFVNETAKFDLLLNAAEDDNKIVFNLEYRTSLFKEETVKRMGRHFIRIIEQIIQDSQLNLAQIELITTDEKEEILNKFNDTDKELPSRTIDQLFTEQAARTPDSTAVSFAGDKLSYAQLDKESNQLARRLLELGVERDQIVGLMVDRSMEMIIGLLGILKAGAGYLPIDPQLPSDRINYMLEDGQVPLLITDQDTNELNFQGDILDPTDKEGSYHRDGSQLEIEHSPEDLLYLIYTSGSTGKPKGAMIEHGNIVNLINFEYNETKIDFTAKVLQFTTISFDVSCQEIFSTLLAGGELVLIDNQIRKNPKELLDYISKEEIKVLFLPTSYFKFIAGEEAYLANIADSVKDIIVAGEQLVVSQQLKKYLKDSGVHLHNHYGPSEAHVVSTYTIQPSEEIPELPPIGQPISNTRLYIGQMDERTGEISLVPKCIAGELFIAGQAVGRGYHNRRELTQEKFTRDPYRVDERLYRTGDLARWLDDGNIEFIGRADHQVKIRGYRVEMGEIESCLLKHRDIKDVVVLAKEDENTKYLVAYYVGEDNETELTVSNLRDYLAQELPEYMIPSYFISLEQLPLTSNGKVDRRALPEPEGEIDTGVKYLAPTNPLEGELVSIWQEVLGVEKIGTAHNFFQLGGHSLKATILTSRIHKELNVEVPLRQVFKTPTIKGLAQYIDSQEESLHSSISRVEERDYYPASSAQKRLYLQYQFEDAGLSYNMPGVIKIEGELDKVQVEEAFIKLVDRHETLRTSFHMIDGEIVQRIDQDLEFEVETLQVEGDQLEAIIEDFVRPFNLKEAPLLRVGLAELTEEEHVLFFDMHHIISDGTSMDILIREFAALYQGQQLPELAIQYKDFSTWQNRIFEDDLMGDQEKYWLDTFSGEIPILNLPTDYQRPTIQSFVGDSLYFEIDEELTGGLHDLSNKLGITLYMVLLGSYNILLSKYSGQEDIVVGSPIAGRHHADLEGIIGMLVNTLAMRNYPVSSMTVKDFLLDVKENALQAYENQDYQFEHLIDQLDLIRDTSRNPLFDTLFVLQNTENKELELEGLKFIPYDFEHTIAKFDLSLSAQELGDKIGIELEYSTKLFKEETMERLAVHYLNTLREVVSNLEQTIGGVEILSKEEKGIILDQFNDTTAPYPSDKCIHQLFEEEVARSSEEIALIFEGQELTYRELNQRANGLARTLRERNSNDVMAIMAPRSPEMIIAVLAVLKAGAGYLPIDPDYPAERVRYMLTDSRTEILLTSEELAAEVEFEGQIIDIYDENSYHTDLSNLNLVYKPTDLLYLIYTSGSTGKPKGAMLEHANMVNLISFEYNQTNIDFARKVLQFTTISFDVSYQEIFSTLLAGGQLYLIDNQTRKSPEHLLSFIRQWGIEILFLPTAYFKFITTESRYLDNFADSLEHIIVAGEQLIITDELKKYLAESGVYLHNHYGPSEAHVVSTYTIQGKKEIPELPPIGKPISNTRLYIGNLDGSEISLAPIGAVGELFIAGDSVGRGYHNREDLTADKFMIDPFVPGERLYRTGDQARWLPDGNIEFLGRVDDQVKIRGYRVEIGEIESRLLNHPRVKEGVVMVKGRDADKFLVAYLVEKEMENQLDCQFSAQQLREYMAKELPDYMVPTYFVQLEEMPMTPNGKINRQALPEPEGEMELGVEYAAPTSEIDEILINIFEEVLDIDGIGINHNFFEMGGNSLNATLIISRIHKELDVEVPLSQIFKNPTITALSQYIAQLEENLYSSIKPVEKEDYYPASSAQKRLYLQSQFEGIGTSYNMPGAVRLDGQLDKQRFEQVFEDLIRRHATLRTSFTMIDDQVVQRIEEELVFEITYLEGQEGNEEEIIDNFIRPFDLGEPPLLRIGLVELAPDQYLMIFDMHHIISDGVSMEILIKEFFALYQGQKLPELKLQYKDFSTWQNRLFQKGLMEEQEGYWLETFSDGVPILNLPTDYPRPSLQSFRGDVLEFEIDGKLTEELKELAAKRGTTIYMLLLAAYHLLLAKYSGQEDIVIGSPIAGRRHADLENIIGMFVNMIALRNRSEGDESFNEFLDQVKETTIKAFDNQEYQFEELVDKLQLQRDLSRNPLFDVVFSLQSPQPEVEDMEGLQIEPWDFESKIAKYDLALDALEVDDRLLFSFEYCIDLFKEETIERLAGHYTNILKAIIANPEIKLANLELLSPDQRDKILYQFNETEMDYPRDKTLHQLIEERAEKIPQEIALVHGREEMTYDQVNKGANRLAHRLRNSGVVQDSLVGIMADRSNEMIIGILAILKAGGAYLPIDPNYPLERIRYMVEDSDIEILLTQQGYEETIDFGGEIINLDDIRTLTGPDHNPENINQATDLAYLIYTSGSTGKPKGVMIQHQSVVNLSHYYNNLFSLDKKQRIAHLSNVSFDTSVVEIFPPLIFGSRVYIIDREVALDRRRFVQYVSENQINIAQFVPMALRELLVDNQKPESLERIIVGGDKLDDELKDRIIEEGYKLTNHYGPTETTVDAVVAHCQRSVTTIGQPIANTQVYILDKDDNLAPIGVPGELCIGGEGLARGYLNRPGLTADKFVDNPVMPCQKIYRTGDLASWQPDGKINFLGRIDNQVKIRGYRIEPGAIEAKLVENQSVAEAVVVDRLDADGSKYLAAYLVLESGQLEDREVELKDYLSNYLPEYMIPGAFIQLEKIPLTPNGKIDRKALPEPDMRFEASVEYQPPTNEIEFTLVQIWQDILRIDGLGIDHNFFEIGGHSLKVMVLVSRIHKELNVEIPFSQVFKTPTIREMAAYIQQAEVSQFTEITPLEKREYYPVSSSQRRIHLEWQLNDNSTSYNMPAALVLEGQLDKPRLERAVQGLIDRHEVLRTSFEFRNNQPVQIVHLEVEIEIDYMEVEEAELRKLAEEFIRPFDLTTPPLLRVGLIKFADDKSLLLFDMHHIISDGVSTTILIRDFTALYQESRLPELEVHYKDYAAWHNALLESDKVEEMSDYWLDKLEGFQYTELPIGREIAGQVLARSMEEELDKELTARIDEFCRRNEITRFSFLLAIFKIILMKTINQNDLTLGMSVAGRDHQQVEDMLGVFLNVLLTRSQIDKGDRFIDYLVHLSRQLLEDQDYQEYPYERLYARIRDEQGYQQNSLFSIMCNYMPYQEEERLELDGVTIHPYKFEEEIDPKFGLVLYINETEDQIIFKALYKDNLDQKMIELILDNFEKVIETVLDNKEIEINQINLMGADNVEEYSEEFDVEFEDLDFL